MRKEPTLYDVIDVIQTTSEKIDTRFDETNSKINGLEKSLTSKIGSLDSKIDGVEKSLNVKIDSVAKDTHQRIDDVIEIMNVFASNVDQRFEKVDQRFDTVDQRFEKVDQRFDTVDQRFEKVDQRFDTMVTKNYLDNTISDLRADLVLLTRKGNFKFSVLVEDLVETGSLSRKAAKQILALEPFPQK
jgi:DNA anti-recombination protein RmuC